MKRLFIFFVWTFLFCAVLYSLENENSQNENIIFSFSPFGLNYLDFHNKVENHETDTENAFFSYSFGLGYHIDIIPHLFSPGIYMDFGLRYFTIISLIFSGTDEYGYNQGPAPLGWWLSLRSFNLFRYGPFDIKPFAGLAFFGFKSADYLEYFPDPGSISFVAFTINTGIRLAINRFGIEFNYYQPLSNTNEVSRMMRISLLWHLTFRNEGLSWGEKDIYNKDSVADFTSHNKR